MPEIHIISGKLKGRILGRGVKRDYRPMSARAREALFNSLGERILGASFLDLYAGSGAVGLEAYSRGAGHVCCVERQAEELAATLEALDSPPALELIANEVSVALARLAERKERFDVIVADPPYEQPLSKEEAEQLKMLLPNNGRFIYSHSARDEAPEDLSGLTLEKSRKLGDTKLSLYICRC